ncbi:heterogeneous nuclear ribonucleoprotein K-like [Diaphorina citri]|uniref:Heterogeneous nuclear ribonucleoprotein K-like n=1 Tax=Diaphorina citri TaxID=121845 RepID=A0A3Q0IV07_DIACI|nr:heterogeneous nuclear ribonucleoprotein K-like [Diaphorina citri]
MTNIAVSVVCLKCARACSCYHEVHIIDLNGTEEAIEKWLFCHCKTEGAATSLDWRNDFKASVTVPDCPGPERILTIFAELENGLKVIEEVLPALDEIRQKYGKGRGGEDGGDGYNGGGVGGLGKDDYDIRLIVHQSQAGCIIGKGGTKIKELRDKTGARIKIYSNCCPQSTDRIAQIFGTAETAINCIREIMELLKTAPVKGADNPYDPHNFDDYYSDEYGGYGAGVGGGSTGPGGRGGGGGRFGTPGGGGGGRGGFGGPRAGVVFSPLPGPGGYYDAPPMGGAAGGYGPPGDLAGPGGMGGPGARNSTQVTIPKDMAGAIIGKAGQRIRKIRNDSGAGITIDEPLPGSNDRIITITGTASQIQMAQYLLQQSVREYGGA